MGRQHDAPSSLDGKIFARQLGARVALQADPELLRRLKPTPLQGHHANIAGLGWSQDGTRLLSGGDDLTLRVWDVGARKQLLSLDSGHAAGITCVRFVPDCANAKLVSCAADKQVRVVDLERRAFKPFTVHQASVRAVAGLTPNVVLSAGEDGRVGRLDVREPCPGHSASKAATDAFARRALLVEQHQEDVTFSRGLSTRVAITCLALDPVTPHVFATGGSDALVRLYDLRMLRGGAETGAGGMAGGGVQWTACYVPDRLATSPFAGGVMSIVPWRRTARAITGLAFHHTGQQLLASYSEHDAIFCFNIKRHGRSYEALQATMAAPRRRMGLCMDHDTGPTRSPRTARRGMQPPGGNSTQAPGGAPRPSAPLTSLNRTAVSPSGLGISAAAAQPATDSPSLPAPTVAAVPMAAGPQPGPSAPKRSGAEGDDGASKRQRVGSSSTGDAGGGGPSGSTGGGWRRGSRPSATIGTMTEGVGGRPAASSGATSGAPSRSGGALTGPLAVARAAAVHAVQAVQGWVSRWGGPATSGGPAAPTGAAPEPTSSPAPAAPESADEAYLHRLRTAGGGGGSPDTPRHALAPHGPSPLQRTFTASSVSPAPGGALGTDPTAELQAALSPAVRTSDMGPERMPYMQNMHLPGPGYDVEYVGHCNRLGRQGVVFLGQHSEFVASGSDHGHIHVWHARTGELAMLLPPPQEGHVDALAAHPYELMLASTGGEEPLVQLWAPEGEAVGMVETRERAVEAATLPPPPPPRGRAGLPWQDPSNLLIAGLLAGLQGLDREPRDGAARGEEGSSGESDDDGNMMSAQRRRRPRAPTGGGQRPRSPNAASRPPAEAPQRVAGMGARPRRYSPSPPPQHALETWAARTRAGRRASRVEAADGAGEHGRAVGHDGDRAGPSTSTAPPARPGSPRQPPLTAADVLARWRARANQAGEASEPQPGPMLPPPLQPVPAQQPGEAAAPPSPPPLELADALMPPMLAEFGEEEEQEPDFEGVVPCPLM